MSKRDSRCSSYVVGGTYEELISETKSVRAVCAGSFGTKVQNNKTRKL